MKDLETELRDAMRERATALTTVPPLTLPQAEESSRPGRRRRRVMTLAIAAALAVGGVAIAEVVGSQSVTPISDRYVIDSGQEGDGSWQLSLYRAQITEPSGETAKGWCLDLDAPVVNDSGAPTTERANICTLDGGPPLSKPIGANASFPGFSGGETLIYGEVSQHVASVDVRIDGGDVQQAGVVPAPDETGLRERFFSILAAGSGDIELVARDGDGNVLEVKRIRRDA
jgi:hypothetical protein